MGHSIIVAEDKNIKHQAHHAVVCKPSAYKWHVRSHSTGKSKSLTQTERWNEDIFCARDKHGKGRCV